jgi:protein-glutamine gamma-glutamyltransferase
LRTLRVKFRIFDARRGNSRASDGGYLGGELNGGSGARGSYYLVRQSDAHAWAEIWLDEKGWQTIDPTAVVAPSRVELGLEESLVEGERRWVGGRHLWFASLYQGFDALEYSWSRWVLAYNADNQQGLLERLLGTNSPWRVGAAFAGLCGLFFAVIMAFNALRKRDKVQSQMHPAVRSLLKKLERHGFERRPGETLTQLTQRVAKAQPRLSPSLKEIDRCYRLAVYAGEADANVKLKAAVQAFKW